MRIASVGHAVFAAVFVAIGIVGLVRSEYAAIWNGVPKWFPAREFLPYLCSLVAIGCGIGLLRLRSAARASRVLLGYLLVWTLLCKGRYILQQPLVEGTYQSIGENLVLIAGAWVLYGWFAGDWDKQNLGFATGERGIRIARVLYGLAMLAFGFSHYVYLELTAPLVPDWLPWHVSWAYFTGAAYIVAGAGILAGIYARLAALLSTLQMAGFLALVWLPMVAAGKMSDFNWGELVVTCALVAGGWVVADSYRGFGWLAVNKR